MNILGIDTSTNNCSVGLVSNGNVRGRNAKIGRAMASEQLITLIDGLLQKTVPMSKIDAIAVSIGPGSYTGLRIGLSTAKGLAFARQLPILPVPTMAVLESAVRQSAADDFVLVIKSHRDLAYHVFSDAQQSLAVSNPSLEYDTFADIHKKYHNQYPYYSPSEIQYPDFKVLRTHYPKGDHVAKLAQVHYETLVPLSSPELEPLYFSEFEAKKWKTPQQSG